MIHSISIKLKAEEKAGSDRLHHAEALDRVQSIMLGDIYPEGFSLDPRVDLESLKNQIEDLGHKVRNGFSGGCYGARDGSVHRGLEVHLDVELLFDRYIYSYDGEEKSECVNILSIIEECGGELIEDLDGDIFIGTIESLGCSKISEGNNTYNYGGHSSEDVDFLYGADFSIIGDEDDDCAFLCIKFHYGGDVRGNYGSMYVYKFDSIEDIFGVIYPVPHLESEDEGA